MKTRSTFASIVAAALIGLGATSSAEAHGPLVAPTRHHGAVIIHRPFAGAWYRNLKLQRAWHRYRRQHRHNFHGARHHHQAEIGTQRGATRRDEPPRRSRDADRRGDRSTRGMSFTVR